MSQTKFTCPHCSQHLEADSEVLGRTIECPTCKGPITLPAISPKVKAAGVAKQRGDVHEHIEGLSDQALLAMLDNPKDYTPDAIDFAQEELERRGGRNSLQVSKSECAKPVRLNVMSKLARGEAFESTVTFQPTFPMTSVQGKGWVKLFEDHMELNARLYSPVAVVLLFLVFIPAGLIPGLIPIYFLARTRKTITIQYDECFGLQRLAPNLGILRFRYAGWRIMTSKFKTAPDNLDQLDRLLKEEGTE